MVLTINTNLSSLMAQLSMKNSTNALNSAIEKMTTGYRINSAGDDAAGYTIASKMVVDLSSYNVAQNNAMLGTSLLSTASSSLDIITTHLQRMRDLAEQAANGTYGADSIAAIQAEIDQRTDEINRVMSTTEYNGIKLFEGDAATGGGTGGGTTTVDESKRVVNQTTFQSGETYYLTTSDDLVKLQDLVNSGVDTTNVTFELMSDINMQGVAFRGIGTAGGDGSDMSAVFKGTFNGNQHVISNLTINTSENIVGLFGASMGDIDSLGLDNVNISGNMNTGGLVGGSMGNITNCYVIGKVSGLSMATGGIVGANSGNISNSYSDVDVSGYSYLGGFIGTNDGSVINCYALGSVNGVDAVGGFVGAANLGSSYRNCYSNCNITGTQVGGFIGVGGSFIIENSYFDTQLSAQTSGIGFESDTYTGIITGVTTSELQNLINNGTLPQYDYENTYGGGAAGGGNWNNTGREFTLQVGIDSTENSQISFDTALGFTLNIDVSTTANARNALAQIDEVLNSITAKQTEFGAVQNRLDSVLDSLSVSIENTTSSLSTIRDADIAEVSADFIRAQILQQASASLLSTANQTPSIALNLI